MAAVAMRKKVVSIGHFSPHFYLQSLQFFSFVRSNLKQFYELCALKIFLVFACSIKTFIHPIKDQKKTELNELNELEYLKTPSQMSSSAH